MLRHGNAKALPLPSVESLDAVLLQTAPVDDKPNENDPAAANASAVPAATIPAGGMDCEGDVCKLVRKKVVSTPEQALSGTPEVGEGAVREAAAAAVAASGPTPPAAPVRGMDCEGGVCKLVRKKKAPAPEQPPSTGTPEAEATVAVAAAADPSSSPAPARTMDCEGGACKLVRKTPAALAAAAPGSSKAEKEEGPLVVGGDMPSLRVKQKFGCDESTPSASPIRLA